MQTEETNIKKTVVEKSEPKMEELKELKENIKKTFTYDEALISTLEYFKGDELAATVWISKYALKDSFGNLFEKNPDDMHRRLAKEIHRIEKRYPNPLPEDNIFELLKNFKYIVPQGGPMTGIAESSRPGPRG